MANLPRNMAEEIEKARVAGGGNYIMHGDYVFMVDKWEYKKIQDECIILELLVCESTKKLVYEGQKLVEQEPNEVGSTCSDVSNFDGAGKLSAGANSRAPVLALWGLKENAVPPGLVVGKLDAAVGPDQPARGLLLGCRTYPKEVRSNKGTYITGRNFECVSVPGVGVNTPQAVQERLAAFAISAEECVKVTARQLAEWRAAGAVTGAAAGAAATAPAVAPPAGQNGQSAAPALPSAVPPSIPPVVPPVPAADPMEGWNQYPADKDPSGKYFWKAGFKKPYTREQIVAGQATE